MTKTKTKADINPITGDRIVTIDHIAARILYGEDARYKTIPGFNRGSSESQEKGNRYSVSLIDCPETGGSAYLIIIEKGAFGKSLVESQANMDPRNDELARLARDYKVEVIRETVPTTFKGVELRIVNEI